MADQPNPAIQSESLAPEVSKRHGVALCLSGGGYRAALFHLGAVRRLDELGVLPHITTISSVSGGSIVNAMMATRLDPWPTAANDANFEAFERDLRDLTRRNIRWIPSFHWVERAYRDRIGRMALGDLPEGGPRFVFCATDLDNGVNWTFEPDPKRPTPRRYLAGSWLAGHAPADDVPLARAVAASSSFPPVLGPVPVPIEAKAYKGGDKHGIRENLRLTDGGVYDNLGLEPVWKSHRTVLVSDGGATVEPVPYTPWKPWRRFGRYLSVADGQGDSVRKRWLMASFDSNRRDNRSYGGAYFGIESDPTKYGEHATELYSLDLIDQQISEIRTDLDSFSKEEAGILENAGYLICDAGIRTWSAKLADPNPPPPKPPFPDLMPDEVALRDLTRRKSGKRRYPFGRFR